MILFWTVAAAMLAGALAFLLPRLLKGPAMPVNDAAADARRRLQSLESAYADGHLEQADYDSRKQAIAAELLGAVSNEDHSRDRSPGTALALGLVVPLAALVIYLQVGDLRPLQSGSTTVASTAPATDPVSGENAQAPEISEAIQQLAARLAQNPEDVEGWYLLGRSYMAVQQYDQARDALARATELDSFSPLLKVDYAEALAFSSNTGKLPAEARDLLLQALEAQPDAQKALWLLGMGAFQDGDYTEAISRWENLAALLEPGSGVAQQVEEQLNRARQAAGLPASPSEMPAPAVTQAPVTPQPVAPASGPALTVQVSVDASVAENVQPGDTVFIFARAAAGPPMPLAVQRLTASQLPATVTLDASMTMTPAMTLATFPEVVVGARISRSGSATPQTGDLEALSDPVANDRAEPIQINIDRVL